MRLYLCGRSALSMLRYLRSINDERLAEAPARLRALTKPLHLSSQLPELSHEAGYLIEHAGEVVHALVPSPKLCGGRADIKARVWSTRLPAGAFLKLTDDVYLSSPAFIFLQMARELEPVDLAMLGMELCGFYSLPEKHTPYVPGSVDETEYELQPVATAKRIQRFCDAAKGAHGAERARMVAHWLADCSASPRETAVFLMLSLSRHWGGYAVPAPVFNPKITIETASGRSERFPDLYWVDESIDVEYQSDRDHSGNWKRYKDSKRQVQLTVNKITVLPLTKLQVDNADDFHEFAIGLIKLLGLRNRRFDGAWEARRAQLRNTVLSA